MGSKKSEILYAESSGEGEAEPCKIEPSIVGAVDDRDQLVKLGKKPVLKRNFNFVSILSLSVTVLITWEASLVLFSQGLENGGPSGLVYTYIVIWVGNLSTFTALCEMVSIAPTSAGQYHWVWMLAPEKSRNLLSFVTGWLTAAGWQASVASAAYLCGNLSQGLALLSAPSYQPTGWQNTLLSIATMVVCWFIAIFLNFLLPKIEVAILVMHLTAFVGILVTLVTMGEHGDAASVFQTFVNGGNWPTQGLSVLVGMIGNAFAFIGADAAFHLAEEIHKPSIYIPRAMVSGMLLNGVLGLSMLIAVCFSLVNLPDGPPQFIFPMLDVFYAVTKSAPAAAAMGSIIATMGICALIGLYVSASRVLWSFARDHGVPFWQTVSKVNSTSQVPVWAVSITGIITCLLTLINIGSEVALNDVLNKRGEKREGASDWREYKRRKVDSAGEVIEAKNPFSKDEIAAEERRPKRKVAVMIGYSGTGYKGMQVNGDEPTIERDLFQAFIKAGAISKANADDPRKSSLARCARTDKGVHAAGNVISLKLIIEDEDIVDKINAALPEQIRIWGIQRTNNSFNCYQYCDSRFYEYLLPSYCLLPPHPQTFLGQKLVELNKEYGYEDEYNASMADVKNFWAEVEENDIKPILAKLDPEVRATVLERIHSIDDPEAAKEEEEAKEAAAKEETANEEPKNDGPAAEEATATDAEPEPAAENPVVLTSTKPKGRELGPVDFALRDIKAAYINAKRRYRITPVRRERLQEALDKYTGTRNFHNYTVQKAYGDPSAKRTIKSFKVNPTPVLINNTEWLSLKVHGQSFMMHQIRKMVGLVSLMVRCGTPLERMDESYQNHKMAIPKAPGLGLLLEHPVFTNFNRRATDNLGRDEIDFEKYADKMGAFKDKEIYQRIFDVEEKENTFHAFFNQIDQFKANHFLWLTAGGLKVAEIAKEESGKEEDVDKQLGDEDEEDPDGGQG
ncbi:hypothetical protein NHJ13734_007636 [Beauveria thailandica]